MSRGFEIMITTGSIKTNIVTNFIVRNWTLNVQVKDFIDHGCQEIANIEITMDDLVPPEEDPENMPSATEELLQIMEDFADVIDKFMFEIVTFLAVVDSAMGLIKDVLGLFGFEGWKMAFFPTFSFIVTTGVFLFGAKKRKGKRDSDVPEGLADAFEAIEDVMEVVEDVAEGLEDMDAEGGAGDGDLSNVLGEVVGSNVNLPIGEIEELQGTGDGNGTGEGQGDVNTSNIPTDSNQNITRKVIAVAVLAAGIIARIKKKRSGGQEEDVQSKVAVGGGEGTSKDVEKQEAGIGLETPQDISQQSEWQSGKTPALAGVSTLPVDNRKPLASTACGFNESVIIDINVADRGKSFVETDWQNAAKSSVISTERQLRWNSRQLAREVEKGASDIKYGIERAPLQETRIAIEKTSPDTRPLDEDRQTSESQLNKNPIEMASSVVKTSTDLAGSAAQGVDQTARRGVEETRKKSGSMLHIAIRLVRLVVRVVSKKKGGSSSASQKSEESTEKVASTDIKGSTESVDSNSVYFDCVSYQPPKNTLKQPQNFMPMYTQYKYLITTSTQTDRDTTHPLYRSEPQYLNQESVGMFTQSPRTSPWDTLRRSVVSMPDTALMEMRDVAIEEIRVRGTPSENVKMANDTVALKPAWLGSRDEMTETLTTEVRKKGESLLHVASPPSHLDEPASHHDEYLGKHESGHLDAPVIVHRARYAKASNARKSEESGALISLNEQEKCQRSPDSFPTREGPHIDEKRYARAGSGPPAVWDRGKYPGEQNVRSHGAAVSLHDSPDGQDLDAETYGKPGYGATDVWNQQSGRDSRVRYFRSSSSYEGLEDDHEERNQRGPTFKAKSSREANLNDSGRSGPRSEPRNLRHSVSYEDPEEESVFEEEGRYQDGDWRSERSSSTTRLTNRGKYTKNLPSSKSRHSSRLTSFEEDGIEEPYFAQRNATRISNPPVSYQISESSGSVESSRSQRRSNMSLSSVRFADEEPHGGDRSGRGSRSNSNRHKGVNKYLSQQSLKHSDQRDSRRIIASNARWNSAICLTGHQKAKTAVSSREPYTNDNYISDETGSPIFRQGSRTRSVNRGASFNRLSRGPSTMSRTQSASYLGDDESDVRA